MIVVLMGDVPGPRLSITLVCVPGVSGCKSTTQPCPTERPVVPSPQLVFSGARPLERAVLDRGYCDEDLGAGFYSARFGAARSGPERRDCAAKFDARGRGTAVAEWVLGIRCLEDRRPHRSEVIVELLLRDGVGCGCEQAECDCGEQEHGRETGHNNSPPRWMTCSVRTDVDWGCQGRHGDLGTAPDRLLRRQDSNLDHRNQNPRCCLYTTADERAETHGHMVTWVVCLAQRSPSSERSRRRSVASDDTPDIAATSVVGRDGIGSIIYGSVNSATCATCGFVTAGSMLASSCGVAAVRVCRL
jgi:hypothetical protein